MTDTIRQRRGDWMQTYTGRQFWPLDPLPEDVFIEDIAHALSMQCRYAGHVTRFYSVAEHSVLIARCAPPEAKLYALLHDASEAYLVDVPRPVKGWLDNYGSIEQQVDTAVMKRFGVFRYGMLPLGEVSEQVRVTTTVKVLDTRILVDERSQVMAPGLSWDGIDDVEPLRVVIEGWAPERAEQEFLSMFHSLTNTKAPE